MAAGEGGGGIGGGGGGGGARVRGGALRGKAGAGERGGAVGSGEEGPGGVRSAALVILLGYIGHIWGVSRILFTPLEHMLAYISLFVSRLNLFSSVGWASARTILLP